MGFDSQDPSAKHIDVTWPVGIKPSLHWNVTVAPSSVSLKLVIIPLCGGEGKVHLAAKMF